MTEKQEENPLSLHVNLVDNLVDAYENFEQEELIRALKAFDFALVEYILCDRQLRQTEKVLLTGQQINASRTVRGLEPQPLSPIEEQIRNLRSDRIIAMRELNLEEVQSAIALTSQNTTPTTDITNIGYENRPSDRPKGGID